MPRVLSGALLLLVACRREIAAPLGANPVHEVLISVAVPGRCLVGGCDPPSADRTNLGLVRVLNAGSSTAYLEACGQQAAIVEQQFLNGAWAFVGPAIACVNDRTRTPDSGRSAGANGWRSESAIFSTSITGLAASSAPCRCANHSAGVRAIVNGKPWTLAASSSSAESHRPNAATIFSHSGGQSRNRNQPAAMCGYTPEAITVRPSLVLYGESRKKLSNTSA